MKLYAKFLEWNRRRIYWRHRRWLKRNKIIMPAPDRAVKRPGVESL